MNIEIINNELIIKDNLWKKTYWINIIDDTEVIEYLKPRYKKYSLQNKFEWIVNKQGVCKIELKSQTPLKEDNTITFEDIFG